jgi:hypothetical protein
MYVEELALDEFGAIRISTVTFVHPASPTASRPEYPNIHRSPTRPSTTSWRPHDRDPTAVPDTPARRRGEVGEPTRSIR